MYTLTWRAVRRALPAALPAAPLLALLASLFSPSSALAADVSLTVSPTTNVIPAQLSMLIADDVFNQIFVSATPSALKRDMIATGLADRGYLVSFFDPGSEPFDGLVIHGLAPAATVSLFTGTTGSAQEQLAAPGLGSGTAAFTGHFQPIDTHGQTAIFTAGIITDVGVLKAQVSAAELSFQTDGPIICQALFQRLAPRAPQYGAQINYAGDRLEVYFDPAYTVTQGGIVFGTTSPTPGCQGTVILPDEAPPCPIDYNGDGHIDFLDYLEFLNLYDAQDPRADLNGDGQVDFSDYLQFLNLYDTGCR